MCLFRQLFLVIFLFFLCIVQQSEQQATQVDFSNARLVSDFLSLSIQLQCAKPSTVNDATIWIYSPDGSQLFGVDPIDNKLNYTNENQITIFDLDYNDNGFYACGYFPAEGVFLTFDTIQLFVKKLPELFVTLNDSLVDSTQTTNLIFGQTYMFTCIARDSRPNVALSFAYQDGNDGINIIGETSGAEKLSLCDDNEVCTSTLRFTIPINTENLRSIKAIGCVAENTTSPFNMRVQLRAPVAVGEPQAPQVDFSNALMVSELFGSSISLACNKPSTVNDATIWIYSPDGKSLFGVDPVENKLRYDSENEIIILNLDNNDEGFYACGYLPSDGGIYTPFNSFKLFVKNLPEMFISINDKLIDGAQSTEFTYGQTYNLICFARGSRPSVSLNFKDVENEISLEDYPSQTVFNVQRQTSCEANSLCTSVLSLSLTLNDVRLKSTKRISCLAANTTTPYEMSTSADANVNVKDDTGSLVDFSQAVFTSELEGTTVRLTCVKPSTVDSPTIWVYSNDSVLLFAIDPTERFTFENENTLSISGLNYNDDGFYACGYSPSEGVLTAFSTFKLFIKKTPELFLSIDDSLVDTTNTTELTYGQTYRFTCIARESRPNVGLTFTYIIADQLLSVDDTSTFVTDLQRRSICETNQVCTSTLSFSIPMVIAELRQIRFIGCVAENTTSPFNMRVELSAPLTIKDAATPKVDFTDSVLSSQFQGSSISFVCNKPSTVSSPTVWIYSPDGDKLFAVDPVEEKLIYENENKITILKLDYNDDGFYACGDSPSESVFISFNKFKLFTKKTPELFLSIGDSLVDTTNTTELTYGQTYRFTCIARESRPSVSLNVVYGNSEEVSFVVDTDLSDVERRSICDTNEVCTSTLSFSATLNDTELRLVTLIGCLAENTTSPFNMRVQLRAPIAIIDPPPLQIDFTNSDLRSEFLGSNISLVCNKPSTVIRPTVWIYSPDGEQIFAVDPLENKLVIENENQITILGLDYNDEGFYACGDSPSDGVFISFNKFKLFIKQTPELFLSIDDSLVDTTKTTELTYGQTYRFTCIARESRPNIGLTFTYIIADQFFSVDDTSTFVIDLQRRSICETNQVCTSTLSFSIPIVVAELRQIRFIGCVAENTTLPFNMRVELRAPAVIIDPPTPQVNFTNAILTTGFTSQSFIELVCAKPSTVSASTVWVYSQDTIQLFAVDETENKYAFQNENVLRILNPSYNDDGYYACGYEVRPGVFQTFTAFKVFVKNNPEMFISVDGKLVNELSTSYLAYEKTYTFVCVARDSRPNVALTFLDSASNSLEDYLPRTVFNVERTSTCGENHVCTSILSVFLTVNDGRFRSFTNLTCRARNTTQPFEIDFSATTNINVTYPKRPVVDFTKAMLRTGFLNGSVDLICDKSTIAADTNISWLITEGRMGLYILEESDKYQSLADGSLRLNYLELIDEEFYACGYRPPNNEYTLIILSVFSVFVKINPTLSITVDGNAVDATSTSYLQFDQTYRLVCTARNSRPNVMLTFIDITADLSLEDYLRSSVFDIQRTSMCEQNETCTSTLSLSLRVNDGRFRGFTNLTCRAENTTRPFEINVSTSTNINITYPPPPQVDFSNAILTTGFISESVDLICDKRTLPAGQEILWGITQGRTGLFVVEVSDKFPRLADGSLRILFLNIADEEFYVCGYMSAVTEFVPLSTFSVYVKARPSIQVLLNSELLGESAILRLNYGQRYTFSCAAQEARPSVDLRVIDDTTDQPIDSLTTVDGSINSTICDTNGFCTTILYFNMRLNKAAILSVRAIRCVAENRTAPYSLSASRRVPIVVTQIGACLDNKCVNGVCVPNVVNPNTYYCQCTAGFGGQFCNFADKCLNNNICGSNGLCTIDDNNGNAVCICLNGYTGANCTEREDPCKRFLNCQNGATCVTTSGRYRCLCAAGFTGALCADRVLTCINGGSPHPSFLYCICTNSYVGTRCEFANPCNSIPCFNGGLCTSIDEEKYICACNAQFRGRNCELPTEGTTCFDRNAIYCRLLKDQCFTASIEGIPASEYCRKTCRQCNDFSNSNCVDSRPDSFCLRLKNDNRCDILSIYYPDLCPRTCGIC